MRVFQVEGTEYETGVQVGERFKERINSQIEKYEAALKKPQVFDFVKGQEAKLKKYYPLLLEEAYGRADGAEVSRDATLLMYSPEFFKKVDGCTTAILQKPDGTFLFSHNEDDSGYCLDNVALVKYVYPGGRWIVGYTVAEKLLGSTFGYNSDGIVFSSNYLYPAVTDLGNISRYFMTRDVLDGKSIGDCLNRLRRLDVAAPFSFNILDTNTNEACNVEKDVRKMYVTPIRDRYARSNHFLTGPYDPVPYSGSTLFRHAKAAELLAALDSETATIFNVRGVLDFEGPDYMHTVNVSTDKYDIATMPVTISNLAYDGTAKRFYIRDFYEHQEYVWNYDEFVPNC